mgnify:CR=1 FL=1
MLPNSVDILSRLLNLPQQMAGAFGVIPGLRQASSGLGYQSIAVGAQTFSTVRATWSGQVRNTGNAPLSGAMVRLQALQSSNNAPIRETNVALPTLAPGAAAPVSLAVDVFSTDPAGSFLADLQVEHASGILGRAASPILGTINPPPAPTPTPTLSPAFIRIDAPKEGQSISKGTQIWFTSTALNSRNEQVLTGIRWSILSPSLYAGLWDTTLNTYMVPNFVGTLTMEAAFTDPYDMQIYRATRSVIIYATISVPPGATQPAFSIGSRVASAYPPPYNYYGVVIDARWDTTPQYDSYDRLMPPFWAYLIDWDDAYPQGNNYWREIELRWA